jgi:membrane associated rhomboid family serine protease
MVVPLYDDNPFQLPHRPVVTWSLIAFNIIVFAIEASGDLQVFANRYGLIPAAFAGDSELSDGLPPVLTLFTYMFLHGDFMHLLGNMIFLWVFGDDVEEALGRLRFLVFYFACGALGALAFIASDARSAIPLIGASGAVSGVVIAYVMLRPCAKVMVLIGILPLRVRAFWVVGAFAILQFISLGAASKSEVAYWCHVGGMVAGGILFYVMRPAGVRLFQCIDPDTRLAELERSSYRDGPWGPRR